MKDTELFELCKEVYKRFPEWKDLEDVWATNDLEFKSECYEIISIHHKHFPSGFINQDFIPLYNSDYLLERLQLIIPQNNGSSSDFFFHLTPGFSGDEKWIAKYQDIDEGQLVAEYGSTALAALLKLTIALDDAGELK